MNLMEELSYPDLGTFGERKVLGLGDWVYDQYKKASNALGDVSLAEPWSTDPFTSAVSSLDFSRKQTRVRINADMCRLNYRPTL